MTLFEKILWGITFWTLCEGAFVAAWPRGAIALTRRIFPGWGNMLAAMAHRDLRKLGAVELVFGILLGCYLLWAGQS